jgi:penicillin-binding protein 2
VRIYEDLRGLHGRLDLVQYAIVAVVFGLGLQFWYVQGVHSRMYREMAENNRFRTLTIAAPRGAVTDRSGALLAENRASFRIIVTPAPGEDVSALAERMAPLVGSTADDLKARLLRPRAPYQPVTVKTGASFSHVAAVEARRAEFPSVSVEVVPQRAYPAGALASHVLGRVGEVTDRQLEQAAYSRLAPGAIVGQAGLEQLYNDDLTGVDGTRRVIVNSRGVEVALAEDSPPKAGASVELTLSTKVQESMEAAFERRAGSAIALDPFTGEILGLVSLPGFDPNLFTGEVPAADWQRLAGDERTPLLNRVAQGQYSPGSLF